MSSPINKKISSLLLVESFLLRDSKIIIYKALSRQSHDLLIYDKERHEFLKLYIATASFPKPIICLKSNFKKKSCIRDFDILYAVQLESLLCWRIPFLDIPDFESLYLGKKYDSYRLSFLTADCFINNPSLYEAIRDSRNKDKAFLEKLDSEYNEKEDNVVDVDNFFKASSQDEHRVIETNLENEPFDKYDENDIDSLLD